MFKLLARVSDGHRAMSECLSQHLRSVGRGLVVEGEDTQSGSAAAAAGTVVPVQPPTQQQTSNVSPITYIQSLLDLKDTYDNFLHVSFRGDKFFKQVQ